MSKTKQGNKDISNNNSCLSDYDQNQTNGDSYWMPLKQTGKNGPLTTKSIEIKAAKQITPNLSNNSPNILSPKTPQSKSLRTTPLTIKTTPNYQSRNSYRKKLFQPSTPESPLLKSRPPVMSSTVYSPMKEVPSKFPWGENIYCYHCGSTVNLIQSGRIMEHLSKLSIEDVGRTVFDLEKLSDTGMASKCVYLLENDNSNQLSDDGVDFLTAMTKNKPLPKIQPTVDTKEMPNVNNSKALSEDTLYSVTDNDAWKPLLSLDILDVEEMLELLDTSSNNVTVNIKEPKVNIKEPKVPTNTAKTSVKDKSLSPIPKRQLRPRK